MDAPLYPPSTAWEVPARLPQAPSVRTSSLNALLADPKIKAILMSEIPGLEMMISNPAMKPHLSNLSVSSMQSLGTVSAETLERIGAKLQAMQSRQGGQK